MSEVEKQRKLAEAVWVERAPWDALYQQGYDYALPQRKPGGRGKSKRVGDMIFDMTAPTSIMHGAGEMQRQLGLSIGQEHFTLEAGPLVKNRLPREAVSQLNRAYLQMADNVEPFFQTGGFDTSMHETCQDLFLGTGALIPMKGPSIEEPVIFVNIPQDELAYTVDGWGRQNFITWRKYQARHEIVSQWPKGQFDKEFRDLANDRPHDDVLLYQDFIKQPDGRWRFVAYLERGTNFIVENFTRVKPIAVPRFYKAPGEPYGRGPVLMALPTIKTVNKIQEMALKSAAIAMLGIWGYRAGGTFNPDTVRLAPGEFWPMHSTGGVLGPDVSRMDASSGRLDVARMMIGNQQQMIRDALLDTRLSDDGGTPASASEVAAKLRQNANTHIGAYGRLVLEIMPVVVPRTIEILNEWRILQMPLPINELIYSIGVRSPMAQALLANKFQAAANYWDLVSTVAGERAQTIVNIDRFIDIGRTALQVGVGVDNTPAERQAAEEALERRQEAALASAMAERAAPNVVDLFGAAGAEAA